MVVLSPEVILGIRIPFVELAISSKALGCGDVVPIPTFCWPTIDVNVNMASNADI